MTGCYSREGEGLALGRRMWEGLGKEGKALVRGVGKWRGIGGIEVEKGDTGFEGLRNGEGSCSCCFR